MSVFKVFQKLIGLTIVFAFLALNSNAFAAPAITNIKIEKPAKDSVVLSANPKVTLSELTAAGTQDPKTEWSDSAAKYIAESIAEEMQKRGLVANKIDPAQFTDTRAVQVLKLNDAVITSITMNESPFFKLPTKTEFDWSIGEGAKTLITPELQAGTSPPKYAFFIETIGNYSSSGRKVMMVGALLTGNFMPPGQQESRATLLDLSNGQIVWYETDKVGIGTDIRTKAGAQSHIASLFKKLPF